MARSDKRAEGGLVVAADAGFEGCLEWGRPVYAADGEIRRLTVFRIRKKLDDRAGEVVVVGWVVVVVCYREGAEGAEMER